MEDLREKYEVVIGLEVHAQLKTKSKIFAPDSTEFGNEQNSQTSAITLGMPGVLPVLNKECVNMGILLGLALNCEIPNRCKFDRKQYFYPDLPKGYQISQYDEPICLNGYLDIKGKRIGITRAHLEEDAGKLVHAGAAGLNGSAYSLVDLNRAGTPLLEIVLGLLTLNALTAADYLIIPVQAQFLAMRGMAKIMNVINIVQERLNPNLKIGGIVITQYDGRKTLNKSVTELIKDSFCDKVFQTIIRDNVSLAEAPINGKTIFEYSKNSKGAQDYLSLAQEVIKLK